MSQHLLILCGGQASRLNGINGSVPKCFLKVNDISVLTHILRGFAKYFDSVIISYATAGELYKKDLKSNFNYQDRSNIFLEKDSMQIGTANAVKLHANFECETLTVINGDTLFNKYTDLLPTVVRHNDCFISLCYQEISRSGYLGDHSENGYINIIKDRLGKSSRKGWVTNGIIVLSNSALKQLSSEKAQSGQSIEDAVLSIQGKGALRHKLWKTSAKFLDIGVPDDYINAERKFMEMSLS